MIGLLHLLILLLLLWTLQAQDVNNNNNNDNNVDNNDNLSLVIVLYRHGDRTPIKPYPTDPYSDPSNWPVGFGHLTTKGMEMQYELGQYLRRRYNDFLGETYNEDLIYVMSSDFDRTLMSAQSNLAGLFPPKGEQVWHPDLHWQPIPIHTFPTDQDRLISFMAPCPRHDELSEELNSSTEIVNINKEHEGLYKYLTEHTGDNVTDLHKVGYIYDTLMIEELYEKTLPGWTEKVYPKEMKSLVDMVMTLQSWTVEMRRLKIGPLISNLVDHLINASKNEPHKKMLMYSGHDTTLVGLLNSLDLFDHPAIPPYASMIIIELRKNSKDGKFFVTFEYRNDTLKEPYKLTVPGCQTKCLLDDLVSLTEGVRPKDWSAECRAKNRDMREGEEGPLTFAVFSIVAMSLLFVVLLSAVIVACVRSRKGGVQGGLRYHSLSQQDVY